MTVIDSEQLEHYDINSSLLILYHMHLEHQHEGFNSRLCASVKGVRRVCLCKQIVVEQFKTVGT
jgi:hypothetical protein